MLKDLVKHVAGETGLETGAARHAVGLLFNAADRQGAQGVERIFETLPGARTLAAEAGAEAGAATGEIARLIERTPGGRRHVAEELMSQLHALGLGHQQIGELPRAVSMHFRAVYGLADIGHLGDVFGGGAADIEYAARAAEAA